MATSGALLFFWQFIEGTTDCLGSLRFLEPSRWPEVVSASAAKDSHEAFASMRLLASSRKAMT